MIFDPRDPFAIPRRVVRLQRRLAARGLRAWTNVVGSVVGIPASSVPLLARILERLEPGRHTEAHPFLSDEWLAAARNVHQQLAGRATTKPPLLMINLVVTSVPFGEGTLLAHADTRSGDLETDLGHLEGATTTVTLPYDVAKDLLVKADAQSAMQALVSGRITVEGDAAQLLGLAAAQVDPVAVEAAARIRAITR